VSQEYSKGYISAKEFVNSWEKEIYELTNLDYFIYLLINNIGSLLENDFFSDFDSSDHFYLNSEEISALSFNIGDSMQLFLEKNCFGSCNLGCPNKLKQPFTEKDDEIRIKFVSTEFDGLAASCVSREDCLYHDVMNYVVIDALLDFYNYEMGIVLHEKDRRLNNLTHFLMANIINFTEVNGVKLLNSPNDLATELFQQDMQNDDVWEEVLPSISEEDEDNSEGWRPENKSIFEVFRDFEEEKNTVIDTAFSKKLLLQFRKFLDDYLEVNKLDELEFEYIDEFFSLLFLQDFLMDEDVNFKEMENLFKGLFQYIDQIVNIQLSVAFESYVKNEFLEIKRTLQMTRKYNETHTYLNFLLNDQSRDSNNLMDGYFEITELSAKSLVLRDVDNKTFHDNIDLGEIRNMNIKVGDILHVQLNVKEPVWKIAYLELIYPAASKYFLY